MKVTDDAPVLPHWINGRALLAVSRDYHEIRDAQGTVLRRTPLPDDSYLQQADAAAQAALPAWQDANNRQSLLAAMADGLERYQAHVQKLLQEEAGQDASTATQELAAAAHALRQPAPPPLTAPTVCLIDARQSSGPLAAVTAQAAAALAAGATVVIRSDRRHPSALLALAELGSRAGLADGVLNIAHAA